MINSYYVYMMGSANQRALYIGVTNNLGRRIVEHKTGVFTGFTDRYKCHLLLYYETFNDIKMAIAREKQLKGWIRAKKEALIRTINPGRVDLSIRNV